MGFNSVPSCQRKSNFTHIPLKYKDFDPLLLGLLAKVECGGVYCFKCTHLRPHIHNHRLVFNCVAVVAYQSQYLCQPQNLRTAMVYDEKNMSHKHQRIRGVKLYFCRQLLCNWQGASLKFSSKHHSYASHPPGKHTASFFTHFKPSGTKGV